MPAIVDAFEVLLDERLSFVRADVQSARELAPEQQAGWQRKSPA